MRGWWERPEEQLKEDMTMETSLAPGRLTVRPLDQPAEMRASVELYRDVLELRATDPAVSPRLLFALRRNGGSVIGAFDGERLVGFAYGFLGMDVDTGELYHYSQAAVVDRQVQGRGVGRALKLGQRAYVLDTGVTRMRWSYDPIRAGNAHFNLDVLGARARWFVRSLYGVDDMGRDLGQPSDRLIVEWNLLDEPSPPSVERNPDQVPDWGDVVPDGADLLLGVPRRWPVGSDRADPATLRTRVSSALERALAEGYVAVSCRTSASDSAYYRLRPAGAGAGVGPDRTGSRDSTGSTGSRDSTGSTDDRSDSA
jgi:predicted GNAT superfamily acetyltransferase